MKRSRWANVTLSVLVGISVLFAWGMLCQSCDPQAVGQLAGYLFFAWLIAAIIRKLSHGKDPWRF